VQAKRIRKATAASKPRFIVQSSGIDNQRIAVPFTDGIAPPGFRDVRVMRPAIKEHLAIAVDITLIKGSETTGVWTIFQGYGSLRGVPMGRQNPSGVVFTVFRVALPQQFDG
jgi:hypothetical protein